MKSAKEKAAEVCRKLGLPVDETENGVAYKIILQALQEHERDMRNACAEAVSKLEQGTYSGGAIDADTACAACMNAKVE